MSLHFHSLTIRSIQAETADCLSLTLDIPASLQETFQYLPGQYLTFRIGIDGEEIRRSYSICSAPHENKLTVAIKKIKDGKFSNHAHQHLKKGDHIDVMPPMGHFHPHLQSSNSKHYLAFAAGSGITPVLSILKSVLQTEPQSRFTLVYGNRDRQSIIFFEELEACKNKYLNRLQLIHVLSRERTDSDINDGRIDAQKIERLASLIDYKSIDECFLCGPEAMIQTGREILPALGISTEKIRFELFTTAAQQKQTAEKSLSNDDPQGPQSIVTLRVDGRAIDLRIPRNGSQTILDAALQQGADLPYACKGGMCCTCKAKLLEGEAKMEVNWGLEEEEVQQGYILTCQAVPTSEKIVVDFDAK
ncbi:MAG: 1,2-phenylacetyl-CoA epoxidase subunit PaaE [Bacteroidota bacterium]